MIQYPIIYIYIIYIYIYIYIYKISNILVIFRLLGNLLRSRYFSPNLQTPPEIWDRLYFLVKTICFSSFQIKRFSRFIFKQSSLRQKFKIQFYHSYLSLSFYDLLRSSVPLYLLYISIIYIYIYYIYIYIYI